MYETVLKDAGISTNILGRSLKVKANRLNIIQIFAVDKRLNENHS